MEFICTAAIMIEKMVEADSAIEADAIFRDMSIQEILEGSLVDVDKNYTGELPEEA